MEDDSDEARVARYLMNKINGGTIDPELEALDRKLWITKYAPRAAALAEQFKAEEEVIEFPNIKESEDTIELNEIVEHSSKIGYDRDQIIKKLERLERVRKKIQLLRGEGQR